MFPVLEPNTNAQRLSCSSRPLCSPWQTLAKSSYSFLRSLLQGVPVHSYPLLDIWGAFLAAALTRVMRAAVTIPAVASASVLQSAAVGGSVAGVVGSL